MSKLPLEGRIRWPAVARLSGISRSTADRLTRKGRFPSPVRCGARCNLWDAAAVRAWAADPEAWAAQRREGAAA